MQIEYQTYGVSQLLAKFNRLEAQVKDWREAWAEIADDFYKVEQGQFSTQGGRGGHAWAPLNPAYAKYKNARYPGRPILVRTGSLRDSLTGSSGPSSVNEQNPLEMRIGSNSKIGSYHFHGTRKMPARRPIDLTPKDKSRWMKTLHEFVARVIRG